MRCRCCDKRLSEFESTPKAINAGEYAGRGNSCHNTSSNQALSYERYDLYDEQEDEGSSEPLDLDYSSFDSHTRGVDNDL